MPTLFAQRPRFSEDEVIALARRHYSLAVTAARPLPSERDQNFRLEAASGQSFVLKIARAGERLEEIELQNQALEWLAARAGALPLPRVLPTASGEATASARSNDGSEHLIRLLTYLPGTPLAQARPHGRELLTGVGRFLGEMDRALDGFVHPAASDRELDWDPRRSPAAVRRHLHAIADPHRRALVGAALDELEAGAAKLLPGLRTSVIHGDANDHNVLVGPAAPADRKLAGLLDFGDMMHTYTVQELAVAVAYAVLGKADPIAAAASVVAGYHEALPLTEPELEALYGLVCLRLCTSVCLSAHRRAAEPPDGYLTISEAPAWAALEKLREVHPRLAHYRLRQACGLPPCLAGARLAAWLGANAETMGPLVAPDLSDAVVFDLSVGSLEIEGPAEAADTRGLTRKIFDRMAAAGAEAAIGRYDEARLVYTADAFRHGAGEHEEWRTIHIGLDLFMPAGSPLRAPLGGRVHAARNNAARLDYGPTLMLEHHLPGAPPFFTLYGHLSEDSLDGMRPGMSVSKGQEIARIGAPPGNGDWPPHVHFQIIADALDRDGEFPGVAPASQREVWKSLCPDPNLVLRIPPTVLGEERLAADALLTARRSRLGPSLSIAYRRPLEMVRGSGQHLYDAAGRTYLDAVNNVAHVGHSHPRVARAGGRQMAVLNTNTRYLHEAVVLYAGRLAATLPPPLGVCFFVCSGSEANELALRLARAHTGGRDVIVVEGAYHGNTAGLVDVSPYKADGPGGAGLPAHVHKVPVPDDYRGLHRRGDPQRGEKLGAYVAQAAGEARRRGGRLAAFICESLLSCAGQIVLPPGYLGAAYRQAREAGAVTIADEVQVGFGRVGTHFWGFETQGVVPDIVTMGKPMGNGHPLAAVVTTAEIAASFANGMEYFNTFGGNPVSCAVGLAVLDVIRDEGLQERALRVGARLRAGLGRLMEEHPAVGDVRGLGLFLGIELVRDRTTLEPAPAQAGYVVERMKDHGILLATDGPLHNVIKIKPPLVFSEADADRLLAALAAVLAEDFVRVWRP